MGVQSGENGKEAAAVPVPILDEIEFDQVWKLLGRKERRRILQALRRRQPLPEPEWASLAVSYARRALRATRATVVAFGLIFLFSLAVLIWFGRNFDFSARTWGFWLGPVLYPIAIPVSLAIRFLYWQPRFREAETVNLAVVQAANTPVRGPL